MNKDKTQPLTKKEMDELFDEVLRPLTSRNARHIFKILIDAETPHLTTLDMQNQLEKQNNRLSKKELNNWLSSLQQAKLVQKEKQRGKPTTIPYTGRYTYDHWKLSEKGIHTAQNIHIFLGKTPTLSREKIIEKTILPTLETINTEEIIKITQLGLVSTTLVQLYQNRKTMTSEELSKKTNHIHEKLTEQLKKHVTHNEKTLYTLIEKKPSLPEKILETLGLKTKKIYQITLTSTGEKIAKKILESK